MVGIPQLRRHAHRADYQIDKILRYGPNLAGPERRIAKGRKPWRCTSQVDQWPEMVQLGWLEIIWPHDPDGKVTPESRWDWTSMSLLD